MPRLPEGGGGVAEWTGYALAQQLLVCATQLSMPSCINNRTSIRDLLACRFVIADIASEGQRQAVLKVQHLNVQFHD